jgi:hypothetical protein
LLLRHPVERLLSHYRWRYKHTVEARPLLTAVRQSGLDTKYEYDAGFEMYAERGGGYIAFSKYSKYVPMWQDAFGKGNVLLLRSEDLKHLHQRVASKCFKFLGVPDHSINRPIQKHTTRQTTRNLGSMPEYFQAVASLIPQRLQHTSYYKRALNRILSFCTPTPPATISEETRQYIGSRLTNDIDFYENVDSV